MKNDTDLTSRGTSKRAFRILRLASLRSDDNSFGLRHSFRASSFVIRHSLHESVAGQEDRWSSRPAVCVATERTIWESAISARCGNLLIGLQKSDSRLFSFCQSTKPARITARTMPLVRWRSSPLLCTSAAGSPEDLTRNDFEDALCRDRYRGPAPWPRKISAGQRTEAADSREGVCEFLRSRRRKATIRIRTILRRRIVVVARLRVVPRSYRAK